MRSVCEHYGYTPQQFEMMTMQQVRILTSEERELGGKVKMSREEARRMGFI